MESSIRDTVSPTIFRTFATPSVYEVKYNKQNYLLHSPEKSKSMGVKISRRKINSSATGQVNNSSKRNIIKYQSHNVIRKIVGVNERGVKRVRKRNVYSCNKFRQLIALVIYRLCYIDCYIDRAAQAENIFTCSACAALSM